MSYAIITDYDLDGCGSKIFASKYFKFAQTFCQGYKKTDKNLDKINARHNLICSDISMSPVQMKYMLQKHPSLLYIDHHQPSLSYPKANNDRFYAIVDEHRCSTMIMFDYVKSLGYVPTEAESKLATLVNVYDLWQTEHPRWELAYNLNLVFWMYNYWEFEDRFENGFSSFNKEEQEYLDNYWKECKNALSMCAVEELDKDSIIVGAEQRFMSEVTFEFDKKLFFILYTDPNDLVKLSVRARCNSIDVNVALRKLERCDEVMSAGGHKQAGGITFKNDNITMQEAIAFIREKAYSVFKDET